MFENTEEEVNKKEHEENIVKDERYARAHEQFKRPPYYLEWSKNGRQNL